MRVLSPLALSLVVACCALACGGTPPPPPAEAPVAAPSTTAPVRARPKGPLATARVIGEGDDALRWGLGARPGDIWVANDRVHALIAGPTHRLGPSGSGGAILHVAVANIRANARLGALIPVFDAGGQRAPVITQVRVQQDGSVGGPAVVHLEGHDPIDPKIVYAQDVMLGPDADALRVRSTLINNSNNYIPDFHFGFLAEWGGLRPFIPGHRPGPVQSSSDWIGASGPVTSLVLMLPIGRISGVHGLGWSVLLPTPIQLRPKQRANSELRIYPGIGGESTAVARLYEARKAVAGTVSGTVNVPGAEVELLDSTLAPVIRGIADAQGRYALATRPGRMLLRARAPGRTPVMTQPFYVSGDTSAAVPLELGPASGLTFTVRSDDQPVPAHVTILDANDQPVWLSEMQGVIRAGQAAISLSGAGMIPLPEGRYRVKVDAGPNHSRADRGVVISAGQMASLNVVLEREVLTAGWYALDADVLTPPGNDGIIIRAADCTAAGIDGIVLLGDGRVPQSISRPQMFGGVTLADPGVGWFAALPVAEPPPPQPVRARAAERLAAFGALKGALAAVLRPRAPAWGYFNTFKFDPAAAALPRGGFSLDFELLEVASPAGGAPALEQALHDYASLLARGRKVVPIGGSGARYRAGRCGVARTWLRRAPASAADLRGMLRGGDVVASMGPMLDINVDGMQPGDELRASAEHTVVVGVDAASAHRPDRLRIFVNGKVAQEARLPGDGALHYSEAFTVPGPAQTIFVAVDKRGDPAAFAVTGAVRLAR